MASIIIPSSGAVQVRINYTMANIADGTTYGKTRITVTGFDAANATGLSVGTGRPAFDVKAVKGGAVYNLHSFPGNTSAPAVPLGGGFSAFPGVSAMSVDIPRTARNEQIQFQFWKYAGYGGGGWQPCFVYGNPSRPLYLGNQVSGSPWASALIDLPEAVYASSITAPNGTIGTALAITISKASTSFTHTLKYAFGSASGTIADKTSSASVSWTPPMSLCNQLPSATNGTCSLTCETYNGSAKVGEKSIQITLSVPDSEKPTVSTGWAVVSYKNDGTAAAPIADYVKGYSRAMVTFDGSKVQSAYGAAITGYSVTFGGKQYDAASGVSTTDVLTASGAQTLTATVRDARGRTTSQTLSFTVQDYAAPALKNISVFRCDASGNPSDSGLNFSVKADASFSSIAGKNAVTLNARYKAAGGSYGSAHTLTPGTATVLGPILSTATYVVEITATDALGLKSTSETTIPTAIVAMNLRNGSDGVAFGKYSEHERTLELPEGWSIRIGNTVLTESMIRKLL